MNSLFLAKIGHEGRGTSGAKAGCVGLSTVPLSSLGLGVDAFLAKIMCGEVMTPSLDLLGERVGRSTRLIVLGPLNVLRPLSPPWLVMLTFVASGFASRMDPDVLSLLISLGFPVQ
eukprot:13612365-Heterocapsa_arctica.AAC.1